MNADDVALKTLDPEFDINEDDLGGEWLKNHKRYVRFGLAYAHAIGNRMTAEVVLKRVEADLADNFRKTGLGEGVRTTDEGIKNAVRNTKSWLDANELLIRASVAEEETKTKKEAAAMMERGLKWLTILSGVGAPPEDEGEAAGGVRRAVRESNAALAKQRAVHKR